ncbi:hypothetical protein CDEST_05312 [Colletotrichum destructivum]|uniref:DUF7053 domain-containing protein n=1 Tax=Colletotrichum destructivum TaxID=34406 RepID=A0AAX4IAB6_9PEZI|nr:hypothetical protein CDEST_05312 [Colletotrichum destructivum]
MSKRTTFTTISPLPAGITREAVLGFLHNHVEMIDLNPLIKERHRIPAPSHAPPEEHACAWYSLTDEISYLPGGLVTGNVSYTCCFHDLPTGMQTHCYAPMGLEIRDKWTVAGCLPGEPVEPVELGIGAPVLGLYIREDVDMRCNVFTTSFVKKTLKKSHGLLVERLRSKVQQASSSSTTTTPSVTAAHQRHASQTSLLSGSGPNGASSHMPPHPRPPQTHPGQTHYTNAPADQICLPYRPSHPKSPSTPPGDESQNATYPEPLRFRHAAAPLASSRCSDAGSQPGGLGGGSGSGSSNNNYAHGSQSGFGGIHPCDDTHQRAAAGQQQYSGGTLQGPFVAELD